MVQHFLKITNKDKYFGAVPKITLHAKCKISLSFKKKRVVRSYQTTRTISSTICAKPLRNKLFLYSKNLMYLIYIPLDEV